MDAKPIGRDATLEEIRDASDALLGHTIADIAGGDIDDDDPTKLKGQFGEILEDYYGMDPDSDPLPDFRKERKELKCKPLKISWGDYFYPKEPLSVGIIDYGEVAETEYWRGIEKLEKKFLNLFIVWFVHDDDNRADSRFIWWQDWSPSEEFEEQIQSEYESVREQVLNGEHLSESKAGNDILQTCPKHNSDFSSFEQGSYMVNSGHPELEKPEIRSWRIPTRFLVRMLADDADLEIKEHAGTEYVEIESLCNRSAERASDAPPLSKYIGEDSSQPKRFEF